MRISPLRRGMEVFEYRTIFETFMAKLKHQRGQNWNNEKKQKRAESTSVINSNVIRSLIAFGFLITLLFANLAPRSSVRVEILQLSVKKRQS